MCNWKMQQVICVERTAKAVVEITLLTVSNAQNLQKCKKFQFKAQLVFLRKFFFVTRFFFNH